MASQTGHRLIAHLALEHPDTHPRLVLAALLEEHRTIASLTRHLGVTRPTVSAALDAFGLRPVGPCSPSRHAEATRIGLAAKRARAVECAPPQTPNVPGRIERRVRVPAKRG
jgi:DNA-binding transcriptional ArsR family regulator